MKSSSVRVLQANGPWVGVGQLGKRVTDGLKPGGLCLVLPLVCADQSLMLVRLRHLGRVSHEGHGGGEGVGLSTIRWCVVFLLWWPGMLGSNP